MLKNNDRLRKSFALAEEGLRNEDKNRRGLCPSHNSGYMVSLRFTQIFAPLRSAKTSYSRKT